MGGRHKMSVISKSQRHKLCENLKSDSGELYLEFSNSNARSDSGYRIPEMNIPDFVFVYG